MRTLRAIVTGMAIAPLLAVAAIHPAFAQTRPPSVPEPSSLDALAAGAIILIIVVCFRLFMLRRQSAKNGS